MREWKPGDVALVRLSDGSEVVGLRVRDCASHSWVGRDHWHLPNGWTGTNGARPLVVLDPEVREQVESMFRLALKSLPQIGPTHRDYCDALQTALRSLVGPPKPPEPTGLGAVVEDVDGLRWVRYVGRSGVPRWCGAGPDHRGAGDWSRVDAVKVLSEGVSDA